MARMSRDRTDPVKLNGTDFVTAIRVERERLEQERTLAALAASIENQNRQYHQGTCTCGAPYDPGKAQLANTPGRCPTCVIRSEVGQPAASTSAPAEPE
jgi:hypothetical protein